MARQKQTEQVPGVGEDGELGSTKQLAKLGSELRIKLFQSGEFASIPGATDAYLWAVKVALGYIDNTLGK